MGKGWSKNRGNSGRGSGRTGGQTPSRQGGGGRGSSDTEIIYGRQPVREMLLAARRRVDALWLLPTLKGQPELETIIRLATERRIEVRSASPEQLETLSQGGNHQGIAAETGAFRYVSYKKLLSDAEQDGNAFFLVLDHLEDPQNVGSLMRTAEAAGVCAVLMPEHRAVGVTPAVVRASAGAAEHMTGTPEEMGVPGLVKACYDRGLPVFGVCLGLQGMVQAFGGKLDLLPYPVHGKPSRITCRPEGIFCGFPDSFEAGRYHSIHAPVGDLPDCLEATAESEDGIVMAVRHREYPAAAVQFHPESLLSLGKDIGFRLIDNVLSELVPSK